MEGGSRSTRRGVEGVGAEREPVPKVAEHQVAQPAPPRDVLRVPGRTRGRESEWEAS